MKLDELNVSNYNDQNLFHNSMVMFIHHEILEY